ncbi:helix-turn-helix domain-containing protein [Nubsella zeaxanthinifaciens]|uniref:helix-turn-helix domain-containing protein n=1 Tax=Nubsella zeaxanthinifaciens TaxID=392412 RepID=UPI000DE25517|nr:AraC family transcriptional regulator [Nubsella zeaxanthinifaciens]
MRYIKELSNRNRIVSENTCKSFYKPSDSSHYTIKFVLSGVEKCIINKREISIFPDSFAMLNTGTDYNSVIDSITPVNTISLSFDTNFVSDFNDAHRLTDNALLDGKSNQSPLFIETLYPFVGDIHYNVMNLKNQLDRGVDNEMLMNEYLYHCLLNYYGVYQKEVVQKLSKLSFTKAKTKEEILKRLAVAKDYINSNYDKNVLLEDISACCCLSVNHLLRTFKEAYGISPYQYLMQLRISRAKYLLKSTDYPLSEIVCLIGFENTSSFIRLFKQTTKMTPAKFRKEHYV